MQFKPASILAELLQLFRQELATGTCVASAHARAQVLISSGLLGTKLQLQQGKAGIAQAQQRAQERIKSGGIVKERLIHAMLAAEVRF